MEDFTLYTEVDPSSHITVTSSSKIDVAGLSRNEDAYVYKDFGVDNFAGDFNFNFEIQIDSGDNNCNIFTCVLANAIDDFLGIIAASGSAVGVLLSKDTASTAYIQLRESDSGTLYYGSAYWISLATTYYCTLVRDESVGTYGTLYLYTYTDADRTTLVDTQSITLSTSKKDYRYLYAVQSYNSGHALGATGFVENLININVSIPKADFNFTTKVPVVNVKPVDLYAIPKADFNFTGKVLTVAVVPPQVVAIPVVNFNFSRFAPSLRTTDIGIQPPKVDFNFTGKVLTVDVTDSVALDIPKASFNFTGKVPAIVLTNSEEEINWGLFDSSGNAITGASPTVKIRQRETGYLLDWSDNTYKAAGGVTPSTTMTEMNAADFPGYYNKVIVVSSWSDGYYIAATTYSSTTSQNGSVEFLVQGGQIADSYNSSKLDVAVSTRLATVNYVDHTAGIAALPLLTEIEGSSVLAKQAKLDFVEKWILNKLVESTDGTTVTLYDDDGVTPLKAWPYTSATKTRGKAT